MHTMKNLKYVGILFLIVGLFSCQKKNDIVFDIYITHSDYNTVQATFVSSAVFVDNEEVSLDFETYSNIGVGTTRNIPITAQSKNEAVAVEIAIYPVGSGNPYTVTVRDVRDGDEITHTVGDSFATLN